MSVRVFLVRHAAHDNLGAFLAGRMQGVRLGPAGRAQARRLAHKLALEPIDCLQTSPQARTRETAQAIAERIGCEIETAPALDEIDFGTWSGKTFADLECDPEWQRWNNARSISTTPSGETMPSVQARMVAHILRNVRDDRARGICMVSHADPIRAALACFLGFSLDRLTALDIAPASLTILDFDAWSVTARAIGERTPEDGA